MSGWRALLSFGLVGVLGFVLDVAVLYAVKAWLGLYLGRILSFWSAASLTWALNRRFTFGAGGSAQDTSLLRQYLRYLLLMLGGASINYAVYIGIIGFTGSNWGPLLGVALGSVAGLFVNFLSARYLVFGSRAR